MTKNEYKKLLESPKWERKRKKILERDKFTCRRCYCHNVELHVHHLYYIEGRKPWEYPDEALVTLCKLCHLVMHSDGPKIEVVKSKSKVKTKKKLGKNKHKFPSLSKKDQLIQDRYNKLKGK